MTLPILESLAKNWWFLLLRGILAVLFAVLAFISPGTTLLALVFIFGVYVLADGITATYLGAVSRMWWLVLVGLIGIVVGIYTFVSPGITAAALQIAIAFWAILRGMFEIIHAIQVRKEITNEWAIILAGILSILFGVVLVAYPVSGAVGIIWTIGIYVLIYGVFMIIASFRLKNLPANVEKRVSEKFGRA